PLPVTSAERNTEVPNAESLVRDVAKFYAGVRGLKVEVSQTYAGAESRNSSFQLSLQRPDKLRIRPLSGSVREFVYDGRTVQDSSLFDPQLMAMSLAGSFDDLTERPWLGQLGGWGLLFTTSLLSNDSYHAIMVGVDTIEYVGLETRDGQPAHHVRFEQLELNWEAWIAASGPPHFVQVRFDRPPGGMEALDTDATPENEHQVDVSFRGWQWNPSFPDGEFQGSVPVDGFGEEAKKSPDSTLPSDK
ncbi:MAG: DUF2092 domain-containing protein, partial [Pirellulaceae bacterium]